MGEIVINENFTFRCRVSSIDTSFKALEYYVTGNNFSSEWLKEDSVMPIFLDTNVLLNIYDISQRERESFIKFLEKNKKRIILSSQVRREYLRHRDLQIRGVQGRISTTKKEILDVLDKVRKEITGLEGALKGVTYRNIVKYGMPETYGNLKHITDSLYGEEALRQYQQIQAWADQIQNVSLEKECKSFQNINAYTFNDPILKALNNVVILKDLSNDEQSFVVSLYKQLRTTFDSHKDGWGKETLTFPGSGDNTKTVDGPIEESVAWADLYIYCQMLKYMKQHNTDVVFITRDVSKGDWLKKDTNEPFVHYIENSYEQTGRMMYIKNSDDYLPLVTEQPQGIEGADSESVSDSEEDLYKSVCNETANDNIGVILDKVDVEEQEEKQSETQENILPERTSRFRDIDETAFMAELSKCVNWAKSYGAGYVGKNYFIFDILGQKKYNFASCLDVLNTLQINNVLNVKTEEHDGHDVQCIVFRAPDSR